MNSATLALGRPTPGVPRLTASIVASVVIHACLLFAAAAAWRALPPAARGTDQPVLEATILALPSVNIEAPVPLDLLAAGEPMQTMLPIPVAPPPSQASLPGISVVPANVPIEAEFAAVGNISSGISNGLRLFGAKLPDQMKARFPYVVTQPPQLAGTLVAMYPAKGARAGRSLALSALLMIDTGGRITEARVLPDEPLFIAAVLAALKGAVFKPARVDGHPVAYWTVMDFRFDIDGPTAPDGKRLDR